MEQNQSTQPENDSPPAQPAMPAPPPVQYNLPAKNPIVTYIILGFTILVYTAQFLSQQFYSVDIPAALGMKVNELIVAGQVWRLITPLFLHASPLHILFNMYALYIFGRRMERFYGHGRFLSLYLLSGFCGNLFSFYFQPSPSLGASTAIFGLVAAEGIFIYSNRKFFPNANRALREIIMIVVINILLGFSSQVDFWGHLGGLVGGLAFSWFAGPYLDIKKSDAGIELVDRHLSPKSTIIAVGELLILISLTIFRMVTA